MGIVRTTLIVAIASFAIACGDSSISIDAALDADVGDSSFIDSSPGDAASADSSFEDSGHDAGDDAAVETDARVSDCPSTQILCDETCVDPLRDRRYCGAADDCEGENAGEECESGYICDGEGTCALSCALGDIICDDTCTDPLTDRDYCGAADDCVGENAGELCDDGYICDEGECVLSCTEGFIVCDDTCIDPLTDNAYCGASDDCADENAGEECGDGYICNGEGECELSCAEDFIVCDDTCIDPLVDDDYCGAQDDCEDENAGEDCAEGYACNGEGECAPSCPDDFIVCDDACVHPLFDESYCGATADCVGENAGGACAPGERCEGGECVTACPEGEVGIDGICAPLCIEGEDDLNAPVVVCPVDAEVETAPGTCTASFIAEEARAVDACGVATFYNAWTGTAEPPTIDMSWYDYTGSPFTVDWFAEDINGGSSSCAQNVTIVDVEAPTVTCPDDIFVNEADDGTCDGILSMSVFDLLVAGDPPVSDNCEGYISDYSVYGDFPTGDSTTVTAFAVDPSSNEGTCTFDVTVTDSEASEITCPDDVVIDDADDGSCDDSHSSVAVPLATTNDSCRISYVYDSVNYTGDASGTYPAGDTEVTFWIEEYGGVESPDCSMTVTVTPAPEVELTCPADVVVNDVDDGSCDDMHASVEVPPLMTNGSCRILSIFNTGNGGVDDASGTYNVGETLVTFYAEVNASVWPECTTTVTVTPCE